MEPERGPQQTYYPQIGVVTSRQMEPYRVKVFLPLLNIETDYLRVGSFYVGKGWGFRALPRNGAEVLVVFPNGDLNEGIVTCALYSDEADQPPDETEEPCLLHESGTVFRFKGNGDIEMNPQGNLILAGGGPAVARVGDAVACPCGTGRISAGSSKVNCGG